MRSFITADPFRARYDAQPWGQRGLWPAFWVRCADAYTAPCVFAYRCIFSVETAGVARIHITADERYRLFLDGQPVGSGPERGAPGMWFFESYDLPLSAGEHRLVVQVWSLGDMAAEATMSIQHGMLLAAEGDYAEKLSTGVATWEAKILPGYSFFANQAAPWREARIIIDGQRFAWGWEQGADEGWSAVEPGLAGCGQVIYWEWAQQHILKPAQLPQMMRERFWGGKVRHIAQTPFYEETRLLPIVQSEHLSEEVQQWQQMLSAEQTLSIPPHTRRRVLVDLETYLCAYPEVLLSDGAGSRIRVSWVEALVATSEYWHFQKGQRSEIEGKYVVGIAGDSYIADGGQQRLFRPLWWQAGRYIEIVIETDEAALHVHALRLYETRYPLTIESSLQVDDPEIMALLPLFTRTLQVGTHETYVDCPYYEELMYTCDTLISMLLTSVSTHDIRLQRKAILLFDASRLASGLTQSRFPCHVMQVIPSFSLFWVEAVCDYALWRDDSETVRQVLPGLRATLEAFRRWMQSDGLVHTIEGWNFFDWCKGLWPCGEQIPIDGVGSLQNLQLVYTLRRAATLERQLGEPALAAYDDDWARVLMERITATFWNEERGMFADEPAQQKFSEHAQCFALLTGLLDDQVQQRLAEGLLKAEGLHRASYQFWHWLFEAYSVIGRIDMLFERLEAWKSMLQLGLYTTLESFEPSRSDCHPWSCHPLYHLFASVLGIRPGAAGFSTVIIRPQLGALQHASAELVHPRGMLSVQISRVEQDLHAAITLPDGINGILMVNGHSYKLHAGLNEIS